MAETYYERLGVSQDASIDEIKAAYREKLKETHPDVSDEQDAKERTKRLIEAKDVLTDTEERRRYDRLGHQKYESLERQEPDSRSTGDESDTGETHRSPGSSQRESQGSTTNADGATTGGNRRARGNKDRRTGSAAGTRSTTTGTTVGGGVTGGTTDSTGAAWADTGGTARSSGTYDGDSSWSSDGDSWRAWNTDGSYAVNRSDDPFRQGRIFSSDRAFILLSVTFLVYPIMLFGALFPGFPLVFRGLIGLCTVLTIAYLQSIPEVGIAVFGTWSVLLPILLFSAGVEFLSLGTVLALTAVLFPLGLSILTSVAIRPTNV